jgi:selenide,water dikinase
VLGKLARQHDSNVLVGFDHADDAGVYQIAPDQALVQTVDFFTPIVDNPYIFGQIAATNSLSDVYAMGGRPLTALAIVCFPEKADLEILERILAGGLAKMIEAGCTIIGGHSIRDEETKFGYSVTGMINPARVLKNGGAKPGDRLLMTKALGTGVISTAIKKGVAKTSWIDAAVASMTTLNKIAAETVAPCALHHTPSANDQQPASGDRYPVHALTDITGFGLIGHLREMLMASENVSAEISVGSLPLLEGAMDCVRAGHTPAGLKANREFAECVVEYASDVPEDLRTLLFDPQTAGGLLVSAAPSAATELLTKLNNAGAAAVDIGRIKTGNARLINAQR